MLHYIENGFRSDMDVLLARTSCDTQTVVVLLRLLYSAERPKLTYLLTFFLSFCLSFFLYFLLIIVVIVIIIQHKFSSTIFNRLRAKYISDV